VDDVKALTEAEAIAIFKSQYFERPKINRLPAPLQASVYDMQVNAGANAIKILQRLAADFGVKLAVDGVLGSKSIGGHRAVLTARPGRSLSMPTALHGAITISELVTGGQPHGNIA
jgi:lysozyme family protein